MSQWGGALGNLAQQIGRSALGGQILKAVGPAVLGTLIEQLNAQGLGAKVNSWLGQGENQPLTADEVRQALGNQKLQEMASSLGIPVEQIAESLAKSLPAAVDQASPNGVLDPHAATQGG